MDPNIFVKLSLPTWYLLLTNSFSFFIFHISSFCLGQLKVESSLSATAIIYGLCLHSLAECICVYYPVVITEISERYCWLSEASELSLSVKLQSSPIDIHFQDFFYLPLESSVPAGRFQWYEFAPFFQAI